MPKYMVKEPAFFGGVLRVPGGPHSTIVTAVPIAKKDMPDYLEEVVDSAAVVASAPETKAKRGKKAKDEPEPMSTESVESFMGEQAEAADAGLETL